MISPGMLAVVLIFAIPLVAIIGGLLIEALKILKSDSSRRGRRADADETQMMQSLCQSLERMEERIEALETLLLERKREERKQ